jgi:hypothetical protein
MGKYKSEKEHLQDFFSTVFGKKEEVSVRAEQIRSNIYKLGGVLGVSVIAIAVLLLKFTG